MDKPQGPNHLAHGTKLEGKLPYSSLTTDITVMVTSQKSACWRKPHKGLWEGGPWPRQKVDKEMGGVEQSTWRAILIWYGVVRVARVTWQQQQLSGELDGTKAKSKLITYAYERKKIDTQATYSS